MEDQHFLNDNDLKITKHRPTFLTVLCIISFVVSGIFLLSSLWSAISYDEEQQQVLIEESVVQMQKSMQDIGNPFGKDFIKSFKITAQEQMSHHTVLTLLSFLSILLSLLGAILMFRIKKIGFHLYVVSKLIGVAPLFILTITPLIGLTYTIIGIFTLAFVIMYAVNLKHMN